MTLTPITDPDPDFVDEGNEIFNYQFGALHPPRLDDTDFNAQLPIYRLQLTDPPVGDFDSQNIEAAVDTEIFITVSFEGPAADVADVRAELRLHFRGANVANATAPGVDFRRNTPDLECTNAGVPAGVTSMCDLTGAFALNGDNAVITLFADANLDREVQVSLFNRRVENSPRDDDLLFRDNEARIIFSPLLVHTGAAASAEGAEGGDAFIIGTVTVGVPSTARSEIVNVTLSVGGLSGGRNPSDFSLLRGENQSLDVIRSDDTEKLFRLPIEIGETAIEIRATAVADLANFGEVNEAFTVSVVTDAAVGITDSEAFSLPFTVTPGPAVIRFADTSPLRFFESESGFINIEGRVPLESGDTFRLSYAQPGAVSTGDERVVDRITYTRASEGPSGDFQIPLLESSGRGCSPRPGFPCFNVTFTGPLDVIALSVTIHQEATQDDLLDDEFFVFRLLTRGSETTVENADGISVTFDDTDILLRDAITNYDVVVSGGTGNVIDILHNEIAEVKVNLNPPRARRSQTNSAVNFRIVRPGGGVFVAEESVGFDISEVVGVPPEATFAIDEFGPIVLRVNPAPTASGQDIILQAEIISPDSGTPSYTAVGAVTISVRGVEIGVRLPDEGEEVPIIIEAAASAATLTITVAGASENPFHPRFQVEPASLAAEFNVNYGGQIVPDAGGFYSGATIVVEADQPAQFAAVDASSIYPVTISPIADGVYEASRTVEFAIAAAVGDEYSIVGVQEQPAASRTALTLTLTDALPVVRFPVNASEEALNISVSEGNVVTLSVFSNLTIAAATVSITFSISGTAEDGSTTNDEATIDGATCTSTDLRTRRCSLEVSDLPTDLAGLADDDPLQGRVIHLTFRSIADTDDGVAHTEEFFTIELLGLTDPRTEGHAVPDIRFRNINVDVFEPNPIAFVAAESGNLPWGSPSGFSPVISFEPGENTQPQITVRIVGPVTVVAPATEPTVTPALIDPANPTGGGDILITNAVSCDVAAASCIFNAPAISVNAENVVVASNLTIGISVAASALSVISAAEPGITLSLDTGNLDALGYRQNPLANVFALQPTAATLGFGGTVSAIINEGAVAVVNIIAASQVAAVGQSIYIKAPDYGEDYLFILDDGTPLDVAPPGAADAIGECHLQRSDQTAGGDLVLDGLFTVSVCRLPASAGTRVGNNIQLPFTVSVLTDFNIELVEALTLSLANANEIPHSLYPAASPPYPYTPLAGGSQYELTFNNTAFDIGFQLVGVGVGDDRVSVSQSGTLREGQTGSYLIGPLTPPGTDLTSLSGTISVVVKRSDDSRFDDPLNPADVALEGCTEIPEFRQVSCLVDFVTAISAAMIDVRAVSDGVDENEEFHIVEILSNSNRGYTVPEVYPTDESLNPQRITVGVIDGAVYRLRVSSAGTSDTDRVAVNWGNLVTVSVLFEPPLEQETRVTLDFPGVGAFQRDTAFSVVTFTGTEEVQVPQTDAGGNPVFDDLTDIQLFDTVIRNVQQSTFDLSCAGANPSDCFFSARLTASAGGTIPSAALTLSLNADAGGRNLVFTIANLESGVVAESTESAITIAVLTPQARLALPVYGPSRAEGEAFITSSGLLPLQVILNSPAPPVDITVGFRATGSQCIGCFEAIPAYGDFDILRTTNIEDECFPLADGRNVWTTGGITPPNDGICSVVIPQGQTSTLVTVTVAADFALQDSASEPVNFQLLPINPINPPYYEVDSALGAVDRWAAFIDDRPFEIPGFRLAAAVAADPNPAIINVAGDTDRNAAFTVHYPGGLGNQPDNTLEDAYRLETPQIGVVIRSGNTPLADAAPTTDGLQAAVSLVGGASAVNSAVFSFRPPTGIPATSFETATVALTINGNIDRNRLTAVDDELLFRVLPEGSEAEEVQLVQIFPQPGREANHIVVGETAIVRIFFPGGSGSAGEITITIGADSFGAATDQINFVGGGGVTCDNGNNRCTLAASDVNGEASGEISFRVNLDGDPVTLLLVGGGNIPGFTASDEDIVMEVRPPEASFIIEAGDAQVEGAEDAAAIEATVSVTFNPAIAGTSARVYLQIPSNTGFGTDWDFERVDNANPASNYRLGIRWTAMWMIPTISSAPSTWPAPTSTPSCGYSLRRIIKWTAVSLRSIGISRWR